MGKEVNKIIVDSSVMLSYILEEEKSENIKEILLRNQGSIFAPNLLDIEVSNVLNFTYSDIQIIEMVYDKYKSIPIAYIETSEIILKIARNLANMVGATVYDSLYHATAVFNEIVFITLDKRYYRKAKHYGYIQLLD